MISLKKHIDAWGKAAPDPALGFYRSLLSAVGKHSYRAVPALGHDLEHKLSDLDTSLQAALQKDMPAALAGTDRKVQAEFAQWAERAFARHKTTERELREIVGAMAKAVEAITARDARCTLEAGGLAARLRSITRLTDIALIREAVVESANSLAVCVERMAETGRQSLRRLSDQVDDYRARLSNAERLSALDPLTGLANRRTFETQLDVKIHAADPFCLILIDLNDFKKVNDRLGHLAGDDVLKSFAGKLRALFPSADLVARWGGDEFAVIVSSSLEDAQARVDRTRRSPIGECKITSAGQVIIVTVEASLGVVEWDGAEKGLELLARADASMYSMKSPRASRSADDLVVGDLVLDDKTRKSGR
jgi:diguanylate cyclase (GGDEF)-like protein